MKRATAALCLALLCVALPCACGSDARRAEHRQGGARAVLTARPEPVEWQRTLSLGGTLQPSERVEIAARVEGAVFDITVDLGDRVRRGQTIARITQEDFAARAAQSDAELAQARTDLSRVTQMTEQDLASREQLEQAQTRARIAVAQRRLAGRQLRDTRIVAPFDGAIAQRLVSPGAFVRAGTPLFVLVAQNPLRLALDVPERHADEVRPGTLVRLRHETGAQREARIVRVAPIVDASTRTFRVEVAVPLEESDPLRPGMYVRAILDLGLVPDAVRLPRAAVFELLGRSRVVEVVNGRAQPRDVELVGEETGVAIVRGLRPSSVLVARSPGLLAPGTAVRVQAEPTRAAANEPRRRSGGS